MTTKHEMELREIEARISHPAKGKKVHPAEIEHLNVQRQREKERDERTAAMGREIVLRWVDGEPKKWERGTVNADIGGQSYLLEIEPFVESEGKQRLKPKLVKLGYQKFAEDWALWKWHIARGSELDEATDTYILDCAAPEFVWEASVEPKKRGRPAKEQIAA